MGRRQCLNPAKKYTQVSLEIMAPSLNVRPAVTGRHPSLASLRRGRWAPGLIPPRRRSLTAPRAEAGDEDLPKWMTGMLDVYDKTLDAQQSNIEEIEKNVEEMEETLRQMDAAGVWPPVRSAVAWMVDQMKTTRATSLEQLAKGRADRKGLIEEWKKSEAELERPAVEGWEAADYALALSSGETAAAGAGAIVGNALITSALIAWGASAFGVAPNGLLPDPSGFDAGAAAAWAAWTLPYAGCTALLGALAPGLLVSGTQMRMFRTSSDLYSKLQPIGVLSVAVAVGYAQAVVWQGVWLQAVVQSLGGGADTQLLIDPSLAGADVAGALGGLVPTPRLPTLLVAPAAVAVVAALEAGFWAAKTWVLDNGATLAKKEFESGWTLGMGAPDDDMAQLERETMQDLTTLTAMLKEELAMPAMAPAEYALTAARIAASSAWLGAEALVTGNLWLSAGTSAAGLLVAMAVARYRNGPGPQDLGRE